MPADPDTGEGFRYNSVSARHVLLPWRCQQCATLLMRPVPFADDDSCPICKKVQDAR